MDDAVASRRLPGAVAAVGVSGLLLGCMYGWFSPAPLLTPDSPGYSNWHPTRSPGYPAFLSLWPHGGAFVGIGLVQGTLLISATSFLAHSVGLITRRTWPAVILGITILALAPLWKWAMQVRPEILFIVFVEVFFGAAARTLVSSRRRWPSIGGVAFACALLVRPVAVGLLPALLLLAWSAWRRKGWLPALLLAGGGLPVVIQTTVVVANGLHRGYYAPQAFSGLALFGKTAPLIPPEGLGDALSVRLAPQLAPLRDEVARVDGDAFYWVTRLGYDVAIYDLFMKGVEELGMDVVTANDAAMRIGMHAMRSDPAGYARLALRHVVGMWSWPWISTEERMAPVLATLRQPDLHAFLGRKAKASDRWLVSEAAYGAKLWAAAIVFCLCLGACVAAVLGFREESGAVSRRRCRACGHRLQSSRRMRAVRRQSLRIRHSAPRAVGAFCLRGDDNRCGARKQARDVAASDEQRQGSELSRSGRSVFVPGLRSLPSAR